jgi:hypothetical protein
VNVWKDWGGGQVLLAGNFTGLLYEAEGPRVIAPKLPVGVSDGRATLCFLSSLFFSGSSQVMCCHGSLIVSFSSFVFVL